MNLSFFRRWGGSGEIRGKQIANYLGAKLNPVDGYKDDICVYVKMQPPEDFPKRSYLDVIDEPRRVDWLKKHPKIGVIASSIIGQRYLSERLKRDDIVLIPQHHCNYDRILFQRDDIKTVGVVGGLGAIQEPFVEHRLREAGYKFKHLSYTKKTREEIVQLYMQLDVQVIWRLQQRPLKNALKIVNACSFGIPTIAYPEIGYEEMEGYYTRLENVNDIERAVINSGDVDKLMLAEKAEEYHIKNIANLYRRLLR